MICDICGHERQETRVYMSAVRPFQKLHVCGDGECRRVAQLLPIAVRTVWKDTGKPARIEGVSVGFVEDEDDTHYFLRMSGLSCQYKLPKTWYTLIPYRTWKE